MLLFFVFAAAGRTRCRSALQTAVWVLILIAMPLPGHAVWRERIFVSNAGSHTVSVVDRHTRRVVDTVPVGVGVGTVFVDPAANLAYLRHATGLSIIDLDTLTPRAQIDLPSGYSLAVSPDDRVLYTGYSIHFGDLGNGLLAIDASSHEILRAVDTDGIGDLAVSRDGSTVYACQPSGFAAFDSATLSEVGRVGEFWCVSLAMSRDGSRMYAAAIENEVLVIGLPTMQIVDRYEVSGDLGSVSLSPDGERLYVVPFGQSNRVSKILNARDGTVMGRIDDCPDGLQIAADPDGERLYMTRDPYNQLNGICTIDAKSGELLQYTEMDDVGSVAMLPDGSSFLVSGYSALTALDTTLLLPFAHIPATAEPFGVDVTPDGSEVWVANRVSAHVSVIDTKTGAVAPPIELEGHPVGMAIAADGRTAYATDSRFNGHINGGITYAIDTATRQLIRRIRTGGDLPTDAAAGADGRVYVVNTDSQFLSIIDTATSQLAARANIYYGIPGRIAIDPRAAKAYVLFNNSLAIVDLHTLESHLVENLLPGIAQGNCGIATSPDGSRLYISTSRYNLLAAFDTMTEQVVDLIEIPDVFREWGACGLDISLDGQVAFASNQLFGSLTVVDLEHKQWAEEIYLPTGVGPIDVRDACVDVGADLENGNCDERLSAADLVAAAVIAVENHQPSCQQRLASTRRIPSPAERMGAAIGALFESRPTCTPAAPPSTTSDLRSARLDPRTIEAVAATTARFGRTENGIQPLVRPRRRPSSSVFPPFTVDSFTPSSAASRLRDNPNACRACARRDAQGSVGLSGA